MTGLSVCQLRALRRASRREGGFLFPMPHSPMIEASILRALQRRGLATYETCPRITRSGLYVLAGYVHERPAV